MTAVYKREIRAYFQSMTGPVFIAFLMAFTGIYFVAYNLSAGYPYFSYTLSGSLIVFLVGIPLITMRSFSEERRSRTDQMLLTAPVSLFGIVMGKYLAMVTVIAIPNVIFCIYPLIIRSQGVAYLTVDYISIFVFFLLGCVYAAIGMFLSALTESQIIAFVSTFGILLVLYLWDGILSLLPSSAISGLAGVLIILALVVFYIYHMTDNVVLAGIIGVVGAAAGIVLYIVKSSLYENLLSNLLGRLALADVFTDITSNSIVDVTGIALYLSIAAVFVFLTVQAVQKRRWS
mgnify:CR=1 FL=1